jgi:hypothetical protein
MYDPIPNAEHLFPQAYAATDPVPLLLQILKDHPTFLAVRGVVVYYAQAVKKDPSRAQSLASALVRLRDSPDPPSFEPATLPSVLASELANFHFKTLYGNHKVTEYGPKNTHLLESLLSGFSFKYGLTLSPDMYGVINEGLDVPPGEDGSEEWVVGACIQLLLHGSGIATKSDSRGHQEMRPEVLASKLKAQAVAGTVKDPHAIRLLEVCKSCKPQ